MSPKAVSAMFGILAFGFILTGCQSQPQSSATDTPASAQESTSSTSEKGTAETSEMTSTEGKTLTKTQDYKSPAGEEKVGFTLVVDDAGVITDAKTEVMAVAPTSKMRQESFAKDFKAAVVGKKLSELTKVDRIGGSSLTTGAFNAALEELKKQV